MNNKKKIFLIIFIVFTLLMALLAWDMGKQTKTPWERKKELLDKYKVK
jgi:hypothetical protein